MNFQINALSPDQFSSYFGKSNTALAKMKARRITVNAKPGYICRISLEDAEIGESVIVLNHMHQDGETPYQSTHAIFVSEDSQQIMPATNEVPRDLVFRHFSVRAFDENHYLVDAALSTGADLKSCINKLFEVETTAYLHLHHAAHGCYAASVTRA